MPRQLVLASNNSGKLRELRSLLAPLGVQVLPQAELGIASADEPHPTFVENALAKARHAAAHSGLPALADDSGICCDVLGGQPGVKSARFAGEPLSDARNNEELLRRLASHAERRAHFVSLIVALRAADDPEPLIAEGRWFGSVLHAPAGDGGFGYDPLFYVPEVQLSAAQLSAEQKNERSHRGQAMRSLVEQLRRRWAW